MDVNRIELFWKNPKKKIGGGGGEGGSMGGSRLGGQDGCE